MAITQKSHVRPAVRHLVRQLAAYSNPTRGYQSVQEVDSEIGSLLVQGYRLVNTHFLGAQKDSENGMEYFGVMYIFQLEQSEIEKLKKAEIEKEE